MRRQHPWAAIAITAGLFLIVGACSGPTPSADSAPADTQATPSNGPRSAPSESVTTAPVPPASADEVDRALNTLRDHFNTTDGATHCLTQSLQDAPDLTRQLADGQGIEPDSPIERNATAVVIDCDTAATFPTAFAASVAQRLGITNPDQIACLTNAMSEWTDDDIQRLLNDALDPTNDEAPELTARLDALVNTCTA